MNHFSVLIRLLRDGMASGVENGIASGMENGRTFLDDIRYSIKLESKIASLLISSSFFFSIYGAIIGAYSGGLQIISSAIKLPALYLLTLVICLPTLYFFDILFGTKLDFKQYVTLALAAVSVISVLLFSFAPIVLFFLISVKGYDFFLLLNVLIMGITGAVGIRLFYTGMCDIVADSEAFDTSLRKRLLKGWMLLYALVGSQLGWTLRPFFGAEGQPFQILRPEINGNFYAKVLESIGSMLGF